MSSGAGTRRESCPTKSTSAVPFFVGLDRVRGCRGRAAKWETFEAANATPRKETGPDARYRVVGPNDPRGRASAAPPLRSLPRGSNTTAKLPQGNLCRRSSVIDVFACTLRHVQDGSSALLKVGGARSSLQAPSSATLTLGSRRQGRADSLSTFQLVQHWAKMLRETKKDASAKWRERQGRLLDIQDIRVILRACCNTSRRVT
jgi:hypothetical protein